MNKKWFSRVTLEVNLNVIAANIRAYKQAIHPTQIMAVVKAYGYGTMNMTSVEPVVKVCLESGITRFVVGSLPEAEELRKIVPSECKILQIGNFFPQEVEGLIFNNIIVTVSDLEHLKILYEVTSQLQKNVQIHISIDTGMGRLGIPYKEYKKHLMELISFQKNKERIRITGFYSHLANAHQINDDYTFKQIRKFTDFKKWLKKEFLQDFKKWEFHLANSWGSGNYPESYQDLVRIGIGLYGVEPYSMRRVSVKSAITLKSNLLAKRKLPAGHLISYDCRYRLPKDTFVGTVSAGYADGIPLGMSSRINHTPDGFINFNASPFRGYVLIRGHKVPVLGKVTMDYTMVDLNSVSKSKVGDIVTFIGRDGDEEITVKDFANYKQTHGYEVLCSLPVVRVPRIYCRD